MSDMKDKYIYRAEKAGDRFEEGIPPNEPDNQPYINLTDDVVINANLTKPYVEFVGNPVHTIIIKLRENNIK